MNSNLKHAIRAKDNIITYCGLSYNFYIFITFPTLFQILLI